ncbi:MAG: hypothetical protein SGPRY_012090, partial [Prymnesium sp.]
APSLFGAVKAICEAAQASAFPSVSSPVNLAPTDRAGADYQNNSAMALFGVMKASSSLPPAIRSPRDVAEALASAMRSLDSQSLFTKLDVAGAGFINIFLSADFLATRVQSIVAHGVLPPPAPPRHVVVDFSSPNVAKEMHVGHLRSTIIGDTICRLLEFSGHSVERINHVGDWGTQFGMLISHLKDVFPDYASRPPPIADLQQFYRDAKAQFDASEEFKTRAHDEVVRLQGGDGGSRYAWERICEVSRREFEKIYSRLGVELSEVGESFYNEYIPGVVSHLEEIGLATHTDADASGRRAKVIFPPGSRHENPLIITKSDGGFGYDSTDMTAIWYRLFERKADWIVYVTDAGQGPHFELVFEAAAAAGWVSGQRLDHCPFGLVCGEGGEKLKTRSGEVVRLVDLLDEAVNRMKQGMEKRKEEAEKSGAYGGRAVNMSDEEMDHAARVLGYGAVKYADLKGNRNSNYIFSYERMLDPKGNTAVYLLYAGARISSILRNAPVSPAALLERGCTISLGCEEEVALGRDILRFQEVVEEACTTLLPNTLCEYAYALTNQFTKFYQACRVIDSPQQNSRILLLSALENVLRKTYQLLGLGYLERI